jgi:hypothetical protein
VRAVLLLALWAAAALAFTLVAPPVSGSAPLPAGGALAAGTLTGVTLFAALARRRISLRRWARVPARRAIARTIVLIVRSAYEEAVWRGVVLGLLLPFGRAAAAAVSTALFAAAHARQLGRRATTHICTGGAFAGLYLATGTLVAPIAAHATYNVTVGLALLAEDRPFWTIDTDHPRS